MIIGAEMSKPGRTSSWLHDCPYKNLPLRRRSCDDTKKFSGKTSLVCWFTKCLSSNNKLSYPSSENTWVLDCCLCWCHVSILSFGAQILSEKNHFLPPEVLSCPAMDWDTGSIQQIHRVLHWVSLFLSVNTSFCSREETHHLKKGGRIHQYYEYWTLFLPLVDGWWKMPIFQEKNEPRTDMFSNAKIHCEIFLNKCYANLAQHILFHRIHGTDIFTYICFFLMITVGKYVSPIDPMGVSWDSRYAKTHNHRPQSLTKSMELFIAVSGWIAIVHPILNHTFWEQLHLWNIL